MDMMSTFVDYLKRSLSAIKSGSAWGGLILSLILIVIVSLIAGFLALGSSFSLMTGHFLLGLAMMLSVVMFILVLTAPITFSPLYRGVYRAVGGNVEGFFSLDNYGKKVLAVLVVTIVQGIIASIVLGVPIYFSLKGLAESLASEMSPGMGPGFHMVSIFTLFSASEIAILLVASLILQWFEVGYVAALHLILNKNADMREALRAYFKAVTSPETLPVWLVLVVYFIITTLVSAVPGLSVIVSLVLAIAATAAPIIYAEEKLSA